MTSEEAIDRIYQRTIKLLKEQLDRGILTREEYDEEMRALEAWVLDPCIGE